MTEHQKECICMKNKFNCLDLQRILDNIQHNDIINLDTKINPYDQIENEIVKRINDLIEFESDEELRYKHIIENMIYVCELQPKNMFLHLCSFAFVNVDNV